MTVLTDVKTRWDRVALRLRAELGEDLYTSWFARMELEEMVREELTLWKAEQRQAALLRFQPGFDPAAPVPPLTPSTSVELALKVFDGGVGGGTCVPH